MIYQDALCIANEWRDLIAPCCEPEYDWVVGSVRRHKNDVHDIEILARPILSPPPPHFGDRMTFATPLDKLLYEKCRAGWLYHGSRNGPRLKEYVVNLSRYGMQSLNPFKLEFYLVIPPAQWGVGAVIRTGPGSTTDNFSRWCVTNRANGGALPDGYRVRHLGVWNADQLDSRMEPMEGEKPIPMPKESDFLDFLGIGWIEPQYRHIPRGRQNGHG